MKAYHFYDAPLKVRGLPFYHGEKELRRLPQSLIDTPGMEDRIGMRTPAVRATYDHAVVAGDKHVWFIDGETLLAGADVWLCTVDNTHPNDLGFHRMAAVIEPVVREMPGI